MPSLSQAHRTIRIPIRPVVTFKGMNWRPKNDMRSLALIAVPHTSTSVWLAERFDGQAETKKFVDDFSREYLTSKGIHVEPKNVYSRLRRDELNGLIRVTREKQEVSE